MQTPGGNQYSFETPGHDTFDADMSLKSLMTPQIQPMGNDKLVNGFRNKTTSHMQIRMQIMR